MLVSCAQLCRRQNHLSLEDSFLDCDRYRYQLYCSLLLAEIPTALKVGINLQLDFVHRKSLAVPTVVEPTAVCLNLLPPNRASLLGLRGLLLHADYTREQADRRFASGLRANDADRVARDGIENPDIYTKRIDKKVFDRWDLPQVGFCQVRRAFQFLIF